MFTDFIGLTIGIARVVDPLGAVALDTAIDDVTLIDVKIKSMVGLQRVMGVALQRLFPSDHLSLVLNDHLSLGNVGQREHAFAVNA